VSVRAAGGTAIPTADTTVSLDSTTAPAAPATPAPTPDTHPLLMYSLDKMPDATGSTVGQDLQNMGINIYGYLEAGYTTSFQGTPSPTYAGRVFDTEYGNHLQLDQLDLSVEKAINFSDPAFRKRGWDIGGKMEWLYGYDASLIHSNGLNFYHDWANNGTQHPLYQFDLEQAYVDFAVPVGKDGGLRLRIGKFDTLLGEETINPTTNYFYSHSFEFGYAIPFTNTGVLAQYILNSQWSFWGGITRGWNQTLRDNNSALDFMGEVDYAPNSQWNFIANFITGPEDTGDNSHYRSVLDLIGSWTPANILGGNLTLVNNTDFGYDGAGGTPSFSPNSSIASAQSAGWFATAFYASYNINSYLQANARAEYYYDGDSFTTALAPGHNLSLSELTLGLTIYPFPDSSLGKNLRFRPEIREDMADLPVLQNGKHYQTTIGMDVIYTF
ncbi:MAG: outer membrane beta-barrel protein, partial [Phycisphaerae bacterium]|nr:outer membrane beta-barrel protein [Phycisphaerae bacterium]